MCKIVGIVTLGTLFLFKKMAEKFGKILFRVKLKVISTMRQKYTFPKWNKFKKKFLIF